MSLVSHDGERLSASKLATASLSAKLTQFAQATTFSAASFDPAAAAAQAKVSDTATTATTAEGKPSLSLSPNISSLLDSLCATSGAADDDLLTSLDELAAIDSHIADEISHWGLDELEREIAVLEAQKRLEIEIAVKTNVATVHSQSSVNQFSSLPHQLGYSAELHSVLIAQYAKLKKMNQNPKRDFLARKTKLKMARMKKKAEDSFDRQQSKLTKGRQKQKAKHKAKY